YADLGVRPVINALGARTVLGGSEPHPEVVQAMQLAGRYYVDMDELFIRSGEVIADMIGAPATLVTPGCAAALVLGTAACLTGDDPQKKAAISERTAAVLYPEIDAPGSYLSVEDVVRIAHRHGLPVIVDSAYRVYPLDGLHRYAEMGADLFGYGAKYFGAPNSTGLLCGREDLIRSARLHSFAGFEKHDLLGLGRPFKVDRQEVFGVLAALRRWLSMDHDERFEAARKRAENLVRHLGPLTAVQIEQRASTVEVRCAEKRARSVADIAQALRDGHPSIWLDVRPHALHLDMLQVHDGDEALIASRLIEELST
ncbi:MAG: aminotransferase class V-fold PLP-dependent enzyme, partial [Candidatus Latescibacterota bacterium]